MRVEHAGKIIGAGWKLLRKMAMSRSRTEDMRCALLALDKMRAMEESVRILTTKGHTAEAILRKINIRN